MSALFNFHSFLTVVLLVICTCTYVKMQFPTILEQKTGFRGFFWKAARIGERLSPWVAVGCFTMAASWTLTVNGTMNGASMVYLAVAAPHIYHDYERTIASARSNLQVLSLLRESLDESRIYVQASKISRESMSKQA